MASAYLGHLLARISTAAEADGARGDLFPLLFTFSPRNLLTLPIPEIKRRIERKTVVTVRQRGVLSGVPFILEENKSGPLFLDKFT